MKEADDDVLAVTDGIEGSADPLDAKKSPKLSAPVRRFWRKGIA